jgi:Fusaric acid resistance protein-like
MEFLLYSASRTLLDLIIWADKLVEVGLLKRNRIIIPSFHRMRKLFSSVFKQDDLSSDSSTLRDVGTGSHQVYLGASYENRKLNPEHLPPRNAWESFGDAMRKIPNFLRSSSSAFGFRVACAAMSLGLLVFLRQTQKFSNENRLFWAVIMTAISMSPTSGQSLFGFLLRTLGTLAAMLLAWVIYYVAGNGKVPGILVLYWVFVACGLYIPIKNPQLAQVGIVAVVTITLIIGYELEAIKLGKVALSKSGQDYFDILEFGPIRLATVLAGLSVAFIWTIFPFPISEHSNLRSDLAASLYLLASYWSIVHETVGARIRRVEGNLEDKNSPGARLDRARVKAFNKQTLLLTNMRTYSAFTKWEIVIGGKFPKKNYDSLINSIER